MTWLRSCVGERRSNFSKLKHPGVLDVVERGGESEHYIFFVAGAVLGTLGTLLYGEYFDWRGVERAEREQYNSLTINNVNK